MSKYEKTRDKYTRYESWAERLELDGWPKNCPKTYNEAYRLMTYGNWPHNGYERAYRK
tara:strand:+ start:140 stop:313 length:174 start_codon:yes stop_codon:yes gene_type:complete